MIFPDGLFINVLIYILESFTFKHRSAEKQYPAHTQNSNLIFRSLNSGWQGGGRAAVQSSSVFLKMVIRHFEQL